MKAKRPSKLRQAQSRTAKGRSLKRVVMPAARIFSGDASVSMWKGINGAKTVRDLRMALYVVCCRLQELEEKVARKKQAERKKPRSKHWQKTAECLKIYKKAEQH